MCPCHKAAWKVLDKLVRSDPRFFSSSSSEVYGDQEVFPTPESYEGRVDALGPRSCYEEVRGLERRCVKRNMTSAR